MTMNPAIVSRTVTGPGLKSRPPMATYTQPTLKSIARARANADTQRQQREAREYALTLSALEQNLIPPVDPQPPAPEMPATLPVWQQPEPDPVLTAEFIAGVVFGAMLASATVVALLGVRP